MKYIFKPNKNHIYLEIVCLNENREEKMDNFEGKKDINHSRRFHVVKRIPNL